jgi:phospholipase C
MVLQTILLLTSICTVSIAKTFNTPVEHVILLMFENRAFDHMAGFFKNVNGLDGSESNPLDTSKPNENRVHVNNTSPYVAPLDPNHSTPATTSKIFGKACLADPKCNTPTMDGFAEFAFNRKHNVKQAASLLNAFTPDRVPIMSTLASEFAIFDRFFASHPGPTFPNRLFQLMGTSNGCTETGTWDDKTFLFEGRTIFDIVEEAGHDWKFYYADAPLEMALVEKLTFSPGKIKGWKTFLSDLSTGNLPSFSWVNPRWFVNLTTFDMASDQHPDHDVRQGELLMKTVYETLRSSPAWNKTALIITYDEHGGFYDHVPPPSNGVPPPDDRQSYPDNFQFDRLGIRIPTVVVSPWIQKGTVVSEPDVKKGDKKPFDTSEFDLTSIISTVRHMFSPIEQNGSTTIDPLTKRDAWSAHFEGRLFTKLTKPRADCPMKLPEVPGDHDDTVDDDDVISKEEKNQLNAEREGKLDINDLQNDIIQAFKMLNQRMENDESGSGLPPLPANANQGIAGEWVRSIGQKWLSKTATTTKDKEVTKDQEVTMCQDVLGNNWTKMIHGCSPTHGVYPGPFASCWSPTFKPVISGVSTVCGLIPKPFNLRKGCPAVSEHHLSWYNDTKSKPCQFCWCEID